MGVTNVVRPSESGNFNGHLCQSWRVAGRTSAHEEPLSLLALADRSLPSARAAHRARQLRAIGSTRRRGAKSSFAAATAVGLRSPGLHPGNLEETTNDTNRPLMPQGDELATAS